MRNKLLGFSLALAIAVGGTGSIATASAVAKPSNVVLAHPSVVVGGKCGKGTAGCHGGKFTGDFFG